MGDPGSNPALGRASSLWVVTWLSDRILRNINAPPMLYQEALDCLPHWIKGGCNFLLLSAQPEFWLTRRRSRSCQWLVEGCLVQVGNGIELKAVGLQFEPYRWRPCGVTWDSSRTVVVIKLRRTSALWWLGTWGRYLSLMGRSVVEEDSMSQTAEKSRWWRARTG